MKLIEALQNPTTGVVIPLTPELAKRIDLKRVMVNEQYEVVDQTAPEAKEPAPVEPPAQVSEPEPAKRKGGRPAKAK